MWERPDSIVRMVAFSCHKLFFSRFPTKKITALSFHLTETLTVSHSPNQISKKRYVDFEFRLKHPTSPHLYNIGSVYTCFVTESLNEKAKKMKIELLFPTKPLDTFIPFFITLKYSRCLLNRLNMPKFNLNITETRKKIRGFPVALILFNIFTV